MDSSIKFQIKHEQLFLQIDTNFAKMKPSLRLFFDDENLLKCRARISSEVTLNYTMIILHHHDRVYHCGVKASLNHTINFY